MAISANYCKINRREQIGLHLNLILFFSILFMDFPAPPPCGKALSYLIAELVS